MANDRISRRRFLHDMTVAGGAITAGIGIKRAEPANTQTRLHLACNQYPWLVFYQREGKDFSKSLDAGLTELAASGMDGYEPLVTAPAEIDTLAPLLKKHRLEMRSLYVNSTLHEPDTAEKSVDEVMAIATKAKTIGTRIIVTNPSPIRWGGPENKNDEQLELQAKMLDNLGKRLKAIGLTLAYHNHDIELRNAAREFHHMMVGTDAKHVTLCLDAHWVYRGAGNSAVALFDVLKLYGPRITELHIRQSIKNIWSETFAAGDIDYPKLADYLLNIGVRPHIVVEQAVESGTPKTMPTIEAFRQSSAYARRVFAAFGQG
ncbi:MAG: sugar phosphate isomerase/epimerase [Sedimentisphaerales bacterium]|nr:sugar phosphate isomerase/epimerase [Sedimentisphaerales bacterium]